MTTQSHLDAMWSEIEPRARGKRRRAPVGPAPELVLERTVSLPTTADLELAIERACLAVRAARLLVLDCADRVVPLLIGECPPLSAWSSALRAAIEADGGVRTNHASWPGYGLARAARAWYEATERSAYDPRIVRAAWDLLSSADSPTRSAFSGLTWARWGLWWAAGGRQVGYGNPHTPWEDSVSAGRCPMGAAAVRLENAAQWRDLARRAA